MNSQPRPVAVGLGALAVLALLVVFGSGLRSALPAAMPSAAPSAAPTEAPPPVSASPMPSTGSPPTPSAQPTGEGQPTPLGTVSATAGPSPRITPAPTPKPPKATPGPTPPPVTTGVTLVGAGDIATCASSADEATAALLDGIPGTVFTTGDNVYDDGTATEFASCYDPSWGRHRSRTRPSPGNHDYHTAGAAGYFDYFGARAGDPGTGYYAYDLGAWRIYALNSNCAEVGCDAGSSQEEWLRADLAGHPRACVLAYWHHPLISSGRHGDNPAVRPLFGALYEAGAEIVLNGHDHSYERFAPQTPNGEADPGRGLLEIVVGTGGTGHYSFPTVRPTSLVRNATTYGVLKLTLGEGSYAFEFVPVAGKTFSDSGSGICH